MNTVGSYKYSALTEKTINRKFLQMCNKNIPTSPSGCQLNSLSRFQDMSHASSTCEPDFENVCFSVSGYRKVKKKTVVVLEN